MCNPRHVQVQGNITAALNSLPEAQGKRIEVHYILGMSVTEIAKAEGVGKGRVSKSIADSLRRPTWRYTSFSKGRARTLSTARRTSQAQTAVTCIKGEMW